MSRQFANTGTAVLILILSAGPTHSLGAQETGSARAGPAPVAPSATSEVRDASGDVARGIACTSYDDDSQYLLPYDETLDQAIQAIHVGQAEPEKETRKCFFQMGEALARHLVFVDPNDPEPRYLYAAAMALRGVEEGGRTRVSLAQRAHEQAAITLTVAPNHAGAQYVLGRIHAAVMRLSGFKRWVATKILGGKALSGASWETAESFLAEAARLQPEVPSHHYELGALYLDTDRPELALAAFERTLASAPLSLADREVHAQAQVRVERLLSGEPVEPAPSRAKHFRRGRRGGRGRR